MTAKNICIIGAGISGLVTAKTFLEEGHNVTVFEKKAGLGGVWEKSRTYPELTSQNTSDNYCFSDYPMPSSYPEWPSAAQIRDYLQSYAQNFGVLNNIKFNTEVIKVERKIDQPSKWSVTTNQFTTLNVDNDFDFIVVCNGNYSHPYCPEISGKDDFINSGGIISHSTDFNDHGILKNKRVVVVGAGKSASDIANLAGNYGQECRLVFRRAKWRVPRFFLGLINMKYLLLNRFSEAWFSYRKMGKIEKFLHSLGKPLVWLFWRNVETILSLQFPLKRYGMLPEFPIEKLDCNITIAPPGFFAKIRSGKIKPIKTTLTKFIPGGVELATGEKILTDVVILGTGFQQTAPFLPEAEQKLLTNEEGNFQLYRHIIHPEIPQMGFINCNGSFYSPLTAEVCSWWLADYVNGYFSLPSKTEMYQEINNELTWMKNNFLSVTASGNCVASFCLRHIEELIQDMAANNSLVIWDKIGKIMLPLDISIYAPIRQKLKSMRLQN